MSLYDEWRDAIENVTEETVEHFDREYYGKETALYQAILSDHETVIEGNLTELCEKYDFERPMFVGFMEGVNTSLKTPVDVKKLRTNSKIKLDIDFEKLYFNMLEAKAKHLYMLPEWDNVLTKEQRSTIKKERDLSHRAVSTKVDRNAPCPCGSGKKYKKCCGAAK